MIGKKILNYRISRLIGEGGMATVYEAIHEKLDTKVAIKVLNPVLTANANIRQRFLQEAKMIASLNHQNIVKVIDYEEQSDFLAIVMEYLDGSDLSDYIKENGKLPLNESVRLFIKVLDAFSYAHSKCIVHRDVKPSNIFLVGNIEPKILDFGIAKMLETDAALTHTGTQMGTPVYMSPELVNADKNIDHRSDIYSLGVTLFYILQGQPPYDATTISNFQIFNKIYAEPLPLLSGVPDIFNQIIQKATAKKPDDRFQSCNEFGAAIADLELEQDKSKHANDRITSKNPAPSDYISDDRTLIDEVPSKPEPKTKKTPPKKEEKAKAQAPVSKPVEHGATPENKPKSKIFIYLILALVIISLGIFAFLRFAGEPTEEEKQQYFVLDSIRIADSLENVKNQIQSDSVANAESQR